MRMRDGETKARGRRSSRLGGEELAGRRVRKRKKRGG